jgi:hypothetical protein
MANATQTITASGSTGTLVNLTFGLLAPSHLVLTDATTGAVISPATYTVTVGDLPTIYFPGTRPACVATRFTQTAPMVDFVPGSLSEADLDTANRQPLYLIEEMDRRLDAIDALFQSGGPDIVYPTPSAANLFLSSTGVNAPVWVTGPAAAATLGLTNVLAYPDKAGGDGVVVAEGGAWVKKTAAQTRTFLGLGPLATVGTGFGTGVASAAALATNTSGGFPVLENVGGFPKIPAALIPSASGGTTAARGQKLLVTRNSTGPQAPTTTWNGTTTVTFPSGMSLQTVCYPPMAVAGVNKVYRSMPITGVGSTFPTQPTNGSFTLNPGRYRIRHRFPINGNSGANVTRIFQSLLVTAQNCTNTGATGGGSQSGLAFTGAYASASPHVLSQNERDTYDAEFTLEIGGSTAYTFYMGYAMTTQGSGTNDTAGSTFYGTYPTNFDINWDVIEIEAL